MQVTEILLYSTPSTTYIVQDKSLNPTDNVVVSINGCLELGQVKNHIDFQPEDVCILVRKATEKDIKTKCENCQLSRKYLAEIKKEAQKLGLDMKIGHIGISLDKSKITVNYTADDRVDFRELVKVLSSNYKSRIEMKQIGNRDETKILGALGVCGREICCKSYLNDFDKVSIKMAKNQDITLNPTKINGMCGRLLCCLKYEDDYYTEMQKKMPKISAKITTPNGIGTVTSRDMLKEQITVSYTKDDTTEIKTYSLNDLKVNTKDKQEKGTIETNE